MGFMFATGFIFMPILLDKECVFIKPDKITNINYVYYKNTMHKLVPIENSNN